MYCPVGYFFLQYYLLYASCRRDAFGHYAQLDNKLPYCIATNVECRLADDY